MSRAGRHSQAWCCLAAAATLLLASCGDGGEAVPQAVAATGEETLSGFDFAAGTAYPARAKLRIGDVRVPPGARAAYVPISLDRKTPNTVLARVLTRNGNGKGRAIEGRDFARVEAVVVFRPGDPPTRTVTVPLRDLDAGEHFSLILPQGVAGGGVADGEGVIRAVPGAKPGRAITEGFRAPRRFAPSGKLVYRLDPARARWSDRGGPGTFSTRLPHGRTQTGNAETGLYLDPDRHRAPQPPITREDGALALHSQQLASLIPYGGTVWRHGAAVLTGERMPKTQIRYGQYEWEAQMPDRRGAWPALWLLPTSGWPPEIDVYEGFGYAKDWNFATDFSANLHGGTKGRRSFTAPFRVDARRAYGVGGFDWAYHRYAVDIAPDFLTWFVDGREVYQAVNPFRGTTWFPLMNVAVKRQGDYTGGSGTMRVRAFRVWRAEGAGAGR
ncbi:MAG: family 16 glycosylhydrolase [Porphyrobacter sp.]|nr:family 16 glycosylhydrolase [Porphyrobacter sp.]